MAKRKKTKVKKGRKNSIGAYLSFFFAVASRLIPVGIVVLIGAGLFFGIRQVLYADSQLKVKSIMIEPPLSLPAEARRDLEAKYLGKNLIVIDLKKIAKDLQSSPEIRKAAVFRRFPSYLQINIDKRVPAAGVLFDSQNRYVVADDGVVLSKLTASDGDLIPIHPVGVPEVSYRPGRRITHRGLIAAVQFAEAYRMDSRTKNYPITKLTYDKSDSISAYLANGPEIRLGRSPKGRMDTLDKVFHILDTNETKAIDYIDIQYDNVIVKKKR